MMHTIISDLESARCRIETKFSEAGGFLQETLQSIGQQLDVLTELGRTLDPQTVGSATQDLLATAETLLALPAGLEMREKKLLHLRRQSSDLRKDIAEVQRLLRYLRAFAFNVKITAAGMGEQAQQFSAFSAEMGSRIDHGEKQIAEFWTCLQALERHIDSALAAEAKLATETTSMLPSVPQGLTGDANAIGSFHASTSESTATVRTLAQRIQMCILNALSALQIGDTVRQRIEHVQSALTALAGLQTRLEQDEASTELRQRLASYVCAMLAAQLEDTGVSFESEATRMMDLIGQIAVDAHCLAEALDFRRGDENGAGLRSLEQSVAKALLLVNGMEQAADRANAIYAATSDAVEDLVRRVTSLREVKDDVQYMALNTSLRCVHIGDAGRPLQVVATELSTYAKHLEAAAGITMGSVEALARTNAHDRAGSSAATSSRGKLEAAIVCLREAADVVEKDVSSAMVQGKELAAKLGSAEQKLNFKSELVDVIQDAASALAELAGEVPTDLAGVEGPLGEIMSGIAKSYTMAREREVHAQFMPGNQAPGDISTSQPAECEDAFEMFA